MGDVLKKTDKICKCGCGKEIPWKDYYKYKGFPDYINGHNKRGAGRKKLDYQDAQRTRKIIKEEWQPARVIARNLGCSEPTLRKYLREEGITVNGLADELLYENDKKEQVLFMPGVKSIRDGEEITCYTRIRELYDGGPGFIPIIKNFMCKKYGMAYTNTSMSTNVYECTITVEKDEYPFYKLTDWQAIEVHAMKHDLQWLSKGEIIDVMKNSFGPDVIVKFV